MAAASPVDTTYRTTAAFRNHDFRLYFIGQLISVSGTWMQNLAQGYLVFQLTQSEAWLGIVACAAGLPIVLTSPIAGVIVERFPRRQLMLATQLAQMSFAIILALLSFTNTVQVWHIVLLALLLGATNALDVPARWTIVSEIVGPDDLKSGIALNSILNSGSRVVGPTIAGIVLVRFGAAVCFLLNALSFVAVIISLLMIRVRYPIPPSKESRPTQQLLEGFAYVRHDALIRTLLLLAVVGGVFILPLLQILPAYADRVLRSPEEGYAAVAAAQGIGSVTAGVFIGLLSARFGYRLLIPVSCVLANVAAFGMALVNTIPAACVMAFLNGFFMILMYISVNMWIQLTVPNQYRGRVMALYTLSFTGLTPFGALALGFVANGISTPLALMVYAVAGGVVGLLVWGSYAWRRHGRNLPVSDNNRA